MDASGHREENLYSNGTKNEAKKRAGLINRKVTGNLTSCVYYSRTNRPERPSRPLIDVWDHCVHCFEFFSLSILYTYSHEAIGIPYQVKSWLVARSVVTRDDRLANRPEILLGTRLSMVQ